MVDLPGETRFVVTQGWVTLVCHGGKLEFASQWELRIVQQYSA